MIIYPPLIGDTIPAFTIDKIVIPFQQNPAVDIEEVTSFELVVKEYTSSQIIANLSAAATSISYNPETKFGEVTFVTSAEWRPTPKEYYKFQMSYSDGTINPNTNKLYTAYSTASIGRCIGQRPELKIEGLTKDSININTVGYTGIYKTDILSEPVYSYRFLFKTKLGEVIQDTGDIIHNADEDIILNNQRISKHNFKLRYELQKNIQYEIEYFITTINDFTSSIKYTIIKSNELPNLFNGIIVVSQDYNAKNNGYVQISINANEPYRGRFILERTSDYYEWNQLTSFEITKISNLSNFTWKDWSIEQGVKYIYAIRQEAENQYSERILSNEIMADFEDMFLSDGKKQLKIAYNPKVSSFKDTILEQKTDTIGSQYPFFFRNNQVKYKEIPISGLISYHMDENNLFMTNDELGLVDISSINTKENDIEFSQLNIKTTNLIDYNYSAERKFKLSVLEWLTNGEPKLFRSPAEGNYVVRLMNTSLSPNDTVNRMLHTFSSTGYEIMNNDVDTLIKAKLINLPELKDPEPEKVIKTLDLEWFKENGTVFKGKDIENINWYSNFPNTTQNIVLTKDSKKEEIYNISGNFNTPLGVTFDSITVTEDILSNGTISFYYYPNLEEEKGKDEFLDIVKNSEDVIFSAPLGTKLYGKNGILFDNENTTTIYNTYVIVVYKDINSDYSILEEADNDNLRPYDLKIDDETIDCSDGQIRYYYNLGPSVSYEKGLGLHLDIYARIKTDTLPKIGQFMLDRTRLGIKEV